MFVGHFIPYIKAFFKFCYYVASLVAMDTEYRNILTFFILSLETQGISVITYADNFNLTFAVKR